MGVLDEIVAHKRTELVGHKAGRPLAALVAACRGLPPARDFEAALRPGAGERIRLIAEVKRGSPSRGLFRADLDPATRLATVSMALELAAMPRTGLVSAASRCHGFVGEGDGRIGRARVLLEDAAGELGYGSGAFMVLKPPPGVTLHPVPMRRRGDAGPPLLTARELAPDELSIVRHADQALERAATTGQPFLRHFWGLLPEAAPGGASCVMPNGPHVGNRVGYVQGGILFALGAATAMAALPETWRLLSAAAAFISPGQGPALKAQASIVHQGQRVAAIRTEVLRSDGRRVLEMLSTHTAIA